jgi:hypothetical protein
MLAVIAAIVVLVSGFGSVQFSSVRIGGGSVPDRLEKKGLASPFL